MKSLEAYNILLQRQINADRLLGERTNIFLLASSFLFLAFVTLLSSDSKDSIIEILHVALPLVGIFLTILLFCFNQSASVALAFWHIGQLKIEEEVQEFAYMRENKIAPHIFGDDFKQGKKEWIRDKNGKLVLADVVKPKRWWQKRILRSRMTYRLYLPITFFVLWITALTVAIVSVAS